MAEISKIEWTDATFNPWWGCTKVSPACKHCYAETLSKRYGKNVWGKQADRRFLSDNNWAQPLKWNAQAEEDGVRRRVFCASMADVFEDRRELDCERTRLFELIEATPFLDWLLLTKRIDRVHALAPWKATWPNNVWLGTTVEDQRRADERLPVLVTIPAVVRFISAEPLLSAIDLKPWLDRLDWVILGGESGAGSRPSHPAWFDAAVRQCTDANVAVHFKQWGDWAPSGTAARADAKTMRFASGAKMVRVGKKHAGRLIGGRTWDELPTPRVALQRVL